MRVLFLSHYALPHVGGIEVVVERLARELVARGHDVTHVASDAHVAANDAVPYRRILVPAAQLLRDRFGMPYPLFSPRKLWGTLRACVAASDIVHAHGMLYANCAAAFAIDRRLGRRRRVLTEHVGHIPYDSRVVDAIERVAISTIGRYTARAANATITLNDRVEAEMRALAPHSEQVRIANGIDCDLYRPPVAGERERLRREFGWDDRPRILFVGRLVEKKGISAVLETAHRSDGDFEVVLAGPGRVPDLPPGARFAGELPPEKIAELYRAADLFLLPSRGEGFPLSVQEAMASGMPVILGRDGGYASMLAGAERAFRMVAPEAGAIIAAIRELLADRNEAGAAAADFMRSRASWPATATAHLAVYDRLIAADPAAAWNHS